MPADDPRLAVPGSARQATPVPATTLTPEPSDSAPACDVTASSATQTSRRTGAPLPTSAASRSRLVGIGWRRGQAQDDAVHGAEPALAPAVRDGVGDGGDDVALAAAHAVDLDDAVLRGVAEADAGLSAVDAQHAHQPALRSCMDASAAPAMSALSWYLSPR